MTIEQANEIYSCLVGICGAHEDERNSFVYEFGIEDHTNEWRFCGYLGFGGKFRPNTMTVDCYQEDETPERLRIIKIANECLKDING